MKKAATLAILIVLCAGTASAHRLDEYLQAALVTVSSNRVVVSMRLVPGVAVSDQVIAAIDSNHDGIFSPAEQRIYAHHIAEAIVLTSDGHSLQPQIVTQSFPQPDEIRGGIGEIHLELEAPLPATTGRRTLTLENRNQIARAVYLVNSVVPTDSTIHITAQLRNTVQSMYELRYEQAATPSVVASSTPFFGSSNVAAVPALFHLGMQHIAEGRDHLLFLLVLLLPAPLAAIRSRWSTARSVRSSLISILKIVTAFTLGHSLTLALAAFGIVHLPSRPVEVLIAVSILVSAIHALRPVFPGREAVIAAGFGLIHGLAFAATLTQLGLERWPRLFGIAAFNLGIESMQLIVVAAVLPSLLLLSRTRAYAALRIPASVFAAIASLGWIVERSFNLDLPIDPVIAAAARHSLLLASTLFAFALASRFFLPTVDTTPLPLTPQPTSGD